VTAGDQQSSTALERSSTGVDGPEGHSQAPHPSSSVEAPGGPTLTEDPHKSEPSDALDGPFTTRQLLRLDEALRLADQSTGLIFSVYVGDLAEPVRETAEAMLKQIENPARAVLVAVSPNQRVLEIVTGSDARKRISDRDAKLAALSMAASFAGGDLAGGVLSGLDQLASHAGKH
jgi:hypothetical protein